ncbi:MAG: multidrug efflux pump subunit AcrA (membrane-fusion protein) [Planctomycetota bacterium]|jgi:multidrug efflux pump subunit AcrA (membrane-fusion protein)
MPPPHIRYSIVKKLVPTLIGLACLVGVGLGANALIAARSAAARSEDPGAGATARALPVETARMVPTDTIEVPRTFTGQLHARQSTELAFEGSGRIAKMLVDEGSMVEAGQIIGLLDRAQLDAQKNEVEARRVGLQARLDELIKGPRRESIDAARSNVEALQEELDLATLQRDRREELAEKGTISVEQLDSTRALVKQMTARLAAGAAQLAELENGTREETIAAQRGALLELDAAVRSIEVALDKTKLKAPFAGMVTARYLDEGAVVSQQMPSAAVKLIESGVLEAHIGIPVDLVDGIVDGTSSTELRLRDQTLATLEVKSLGTVAPGTRTVTAIFLIDPAAAERTSARPGDVVLLYSKVTRMEQGAWVPLGALSESARGLWSVYAVQPPESGDGPATAVRIELEVLTANESEAFVRGTFTGETIIVASGAGRIVVGQAIEPTEPAAPNRGTSPSR